MKKFFEKAKLEYKFKKAGGGHTLADDGSASSQQQASTSRTPAVRTAPSSDAQKAGQAALERFTVHEKNAVKKPKSATATWKHSEPVASSSQSSSTGDALNVNQLKREVRQELAYQEASQQRDLQKNFQSTAEQPSHVECSTVLSHEGVYFICPVCPVTVLQSEINAHLSECLSKQYLEEPLTTSCSMIYSLNKEKEKVKACVDLLCRYLDNICKNPEEEKYQKIKQSNKIFQERVAPIKGATEFLLACGFEDKVIPVEDSEEKFFVLPKEVCSDCERLNVFKEVLVSSEALKAKLDRCLKVYKLSSQASHFEVPSDFFNKTAEEVKREQIARTEEVERSSQLRTRAMREAEKRPLKTYRFTLVRIRFPDGIILQGTFYSREKLRDVFEFVRQSLASDWQPFLLSEAGRQLTDENASLVDLGLVPAAVVSFKWDPVVMKDILAAQGQVDENAHLKPEVLSRVQELS